MSGNPFASPLCSLGMFSEAVPPCLSSLSGEMGDHRRGGNRNGFGGWVGWVGGMGWIPIIEFQNVNSPFHVFWKLLIPCSRFPRIYSTILQDYSAHVCSIFSFLRLCTFQKYMFYVFELLILWDTSAEPTSNLRIPKGRWHFQYSENHAHPIVLYFLPAKLGSD